MRKIALLTSGGDAPGMNTVIHVVVRSSMAYGIDVMGVERGFDGLIKDEMKLMNRASIEGIMQRGGTVLKTGRSEEFRTEEGRLQAVKNLKLHGIEAVIVCGGDGSFNGALELSKLGITVICIPCTIDNDMGYTDYTIGFDTAVGTVLDAVSKIQDTASSHDRSTIVEVMGRNCGDIAVYAGLTVGAECVLIPEIPIKPEAVCQKIIEAKDRGKSHGIIIRAEGSDISTDELADLVYAETGIEVRKVVLAYVQRGGSPSMMDRLRACLLGHEAVKLINEGSESAAVGIKDDHPIRIDLKEAVDTPTICNLKLIELSEHLSK
ncbi:MAG: ATP-dependent 6-phosphofructokinase [Bacillota bacterium]|nr:ATP-dependent 6-phosphofructokinase [Bacillota bacterium]